MSGADITIQERPEIHPIEDENPDLIPLKINTENMTPDLPAFLIISTIVLLIGAYITYRNPWFKNSKNAPYTWFIYIGTILSLFIPAFVSYKSSIYGDRENRIYIAVVFLLLMATSALMYYFFWARINPPMGIIFSIIMILLLLALMALCFEKDKIGFYLLFIPLSWSMYIIYWCITVNKFGLT